MAAERFYSGAEDCQWLRETALREYEVPAFQSFTLEGNEDCPLVIRLYEQAEPTIDDGAVAFYQLVTDAESGVDYYRRR